MSRLLPVQTEVPGCYGCGRENPSGLKLRFTREDDATISTQFTPPKEWTGWADLLHGGFSALLLDETMAWAVMALTEEMNFVTRKLEIRYLRPTHVQQPLTVYAKLLEDRGRDLLVHGWITDGQGTKLTQADATMARVSEEKMQELLGERDSRKGMDPVDD